MEKPKEQFDIDEESAAKMEEEDLMVRKAEEYQQNHQQSYSDDEKSEEEDEVSDQEPIMHVSRPTIGVKQPVSQSLRNQNQEEQLKKLQEALERT